ncbi:MAG: hypothetical protein RL510_863 [Actinomycetota bacterium]|jgi:hypothetical protein
MPIEKPKYKLLKSALGIELREYEEHWLAECVVENTADLRLASNRAFNKLFNYISGDNQPGQKIAMTSPVQQEPSKSGWLVSFVVPSSYKAAEIPVPRNSSISIKRVPAGTFAALRYRGAWNNETFERRSKQLREALQELGLKPVGEVTSAVYNPPLTPPLLRRNEVLVRYE